MKRKQAPRAQPPSKSVKSAIATRLPVEKCIEEPGRLYHDLGHLAGTWVEDPIFDAIIAEQDRVGGGAGR